MHYTLTYQRALNFGAALQAYALAKFLNDNGKPTQVIDYLPGYMNWQTKRPMKSVRGSIEKFKKYQKFSQFRRDFMPLTPKTFYSMNALKSLPNVESLIVGSDQVWNPMLHGKQSFDMSYLFAWPEASEYKKVGYAVSAGSVRFNDVFSAQHIGAVADFAAIGCRESRLLEDLLAQSDLDFSSTPLKTVLDPSLLLRDYSALEVPEIVPNQPYIVSYVVGSGEMLTSFEQRVAEAKEVLGLPVIHIGAKRIKNADQNILDIGPREWLTYIKNADFVLTNSFHGCAFSLNFEKQFTIVPHKLSELNERQKTLLAGVGLSERLLEDNAPITAENTNAIDYQQVSPALEKLIDASQSFLVEQL